MHREVDHTAGDSSLRIDTDAACISLQYSLQYGCDGMQAPSCRWLLSSHPAACDDAVKVAAEARAMVLLNLHMHAYQLSPEITFVDHF